MPEELFPEETVTTCGCPLCKDVCPVCESEYLVPGDIMGPNCLAFYEDNWKGTAVTKERMVAEELGLTSDPNL